MALLPVDQWKVEANRKGLFLSVRKELGYRVWLTLRFPWARRPNP